MNQKPRILIFRIGELGDTLVALPAIRAIREAFPKAHIAMLSNLHPAAQHVTPSEVLPVGLVDDWLTYPSADSRTAPINTLRLMFRLRRLHYDTLVYLVPRLRKTLATRRDLLFFRLAGITRILAAEGFEPLPPRSANGDGLPNVVHESEHLLNRLSLSGITVPSPADAAFDLELQNDEFAVADRWIDKAVPGIAASRLIGMGPGSKWPSKVWPEDSFIELGQRLIRNHGVYPIIFGGQSDRDIAERLLCAWGTGASAAGELNPRQAAAALSRCLLYVGNDTGTMHMSAAVGIPCVAIMSAQDWPGRWNPYGPDHIVLRQRIHCEGCLLRVCKHEGLQCLKSIKVEEVVEACEHVLRRHEQRAHSATSGSPAHV